MKRIASLLVLLAVGLFTIGCGNGEEKKAPPATPAGDGGEKAGDEKMQGDAEGEVEPPKETGGAGVEVTTPEGQPQEKDEADIDSGVNLDGGN